MELYIYNADRTMIGLIESYEYLRWTRRYSFSGDFELKAVASPTNIELLKMGNFLWKSDDLEAAVIEHVSFVSSAEDSLLIQGRFATGILARRIVWGTENLSGDVSAAVKQLINKHFISPSLTARKIAGFTFSSGTFGYSIQGQTSYRNLLEAVENYCDTADVGVRTVWNHDAKSFDIELYRGAESLAVFSQEYDNLIEQEYTHSRLNYSNVALVAGEGEGSARKLVSVGSSSSMDRYEMFVDAKDLRSEDFSTSSLYTQALALKGQNNLAERPEAHAFDAVVNAHGNLVYKTDFDLGQIVRVVSVPLGLTLHARISEIVETYDGEGRHLQAVFGKGLLSFAKNLKGVF